MKGVFFRSILQAAVLAIFVFSSCNSGPQPVSESSPSPITEAEKIEPVETQLEAAVEEPPHEEAVFDPANVTQEKYEATLEDIRTFIRNLNVIIRNRNYSAWTEHLSAAFIEKIKDERFLEARADELYKRDQLMAASLGRDPNRLKKKPMGNPRDYFELVVVPARSNDRVDDIDFVAEDRVIAFTVNARGNRLILYDLIVVDGKWKIAN